MLLLLIYFIHVAAYKISTECLISNEFSIAPGYQAFVGEFSFGSIIKLSWDFQGEF